MGTRSLRGRLSESTNIWPGFVDVLATLLIVIIFILMVFTVSQIYLSDAISGRDKALQNLKNQISELSKILNIEIEEKQQVLSNLSETQSELEDTKQNLQTQQFISEELQADVAKKRSELFVQEQNVLALSDQIANLLSELRIVSNALETYEGFDNATLDTKGLGERINKALATRIDQLKSLNNKLDETNQKLAISENNLNTKVIELNKKNSDLLAINESLGLEDADLTAQLNAIKNKNEELIKLNNNLIESQQQTESANYLLEQVNIELTLRDQELQAQVTQYQELMNDLLEINDSLGLKDASLQDQLEAIRFKNQELARLNTNLIQKDSTIFDLRGKIIELNNILSISEETQLSQKSQILTLEKNLQTLQEESGVQKEISLKKIQEMELQSSQTLEQVSILSTEIDNLKNEIATLNIALEASEKETETKNLEIEVLGERLNKALTSKVFELQKYRSEFFGKLQSLLGDRKDIKVVGDRFIFESELLFDSASANLQKEGKEKLKEIGITLKETTIQIPLDIDWIIQVEGHTDKRPINTSKYPSNWELSSARANSVLKLLLELGFEPNRLSAAGYGEFYPISEGDTERDLQQNRRIELKLTSR